MGTIVIVVGGIFLVGIVLALAVVKAIYSSDKASSKISSLLLKK